MNEYFEGAVNQLLERGQNLISMIPTGLPREFSALERTCRDKLTGKLDDLRKLIGEEIWYLPENQPERLREFKRLVRDLDILETVCIAALERAHKTSDLHLNRLVERIRQEIAYPLPSPVVTPLSQAYFQTWPEYHLMLVPLSEGDFLLHLPDIYHELAHLLLREKYDPKIKPFIDAFFDVVIQITAYTESELEKEERKNGPEQLSAYLELWLDCWLKGWAEEFFCDLFAVYSLGPAFVWSHFHLSATRGDDPYRVPLRRVTTHPPDGARMTAMLDGLTLIGFGKEAVEIEERWNHLVATAQSQPEAEYHRCFPKQIIKLFAEKALEGVKGMKCRIAKPETVDYVHSVFNQAWNEFWGDPGRYVEWEKQAIEALRHECLKP